MKALKYSIIACWCIIAVSIFALVSLHMICLNICYELNEFLSSLFGNILAGGIASIIITYVCYFRETHNTVFSLKRCEGDILRFLTTLLCGYYTLIPSVESTIRFKSDYQKMQESYREMILSCNEYSPFIKTKETRFLLGSKKSLQRFVVEASWVNDALLLADTEEKMREIITKVFTSEKANESLYRDMSKTLFDL